MEFNEALGTAETITSREDDFEYGLAHDCEKLLQKYRASSKDVTAVESFCKDVEQTLDCYGYSVELFA